MVAVGTEAATLSTRDALSPLPPTPVLAPMPVPMPAELAPPPPQQQPEAVGLTERLSAARSQLHPEGSEAAAFSQPPTSAACAPENIANVANIANIASDQRTAYLDYLRLCLRQQRVPAPEVVEMGRASSGSGGLQDGSLVSLQIRMTEEALGI